MNASACPATEIEADTGLTRSLAEFVAGLSAADVPARLRDILGDAVLDSLACALFGLTTEACLTIRDFAAAEGGPGVSSIWGSSGACRVSPLNAALANSSAVHGFDFDDHSRAKIHPGAVVVPATLALAEARGCDGPTFLTAIAAGYEVMNRVSLAANPNASRTKGWHLTGTTGTFAAAAAASVILGFDAERTASAFGIAGTQSSGLWAFNADGAMTKRLHPGLAARGGLTAALLAERSFFGGSHVLEAADGGFLAATSDATRPHEVVRDLGSVWRAEGACFKPYACCGSNHASVDAALALKTENDIDPGGIERVTVGVSRVVLLQTGFAYRRSTVLNAQMSIRYNIAVALLDDAALLAQFAEQRLDDPVLEALIGRIDVVVDADMDAIYPERYAGIVTIAMKDGRRFSRRVDVSRGMPENPMSRDEIAAKAASLVEASAGGDFFPRLLDALNGLFESADVGHVGRLMGAARVGSVTSDLPSAPSSLSSKPELS